MVRFSDISPFVKQIVTNLYLVRLLCLPRRAVTANVHMEAL